MDEQRQPEGSTGHAEAAAWRVNGAPNNAGAHAVDQGWLSPAATPEQPAQATAPAAGELGARHRQPAPGLDDDTPPGGVPTVEPPLWREAVRNTGTTYGGYRAPYPGYQPSPVNDPAEEPERSPLEPASAAPAGEQPVGSAGVVTVPAQRGHGAAAPTVEPPIAPTGPGRTAYTPPPPGRVEPAYAPPEPAYAPPEPAYAPPEPAYAPPEPAYAPPEPDQAGRAGLSPSAMPTLTPDSGDPFSGAPVSLPQRVPAEPDVPATADPEPADPGTDPDLDAQDRWTAPELAWIADQLRRDDVPGEVPAEPLDVDAVMEAVREVAGIRSASVRLGPTGMHTLRLDLADDADPGQVSSAVARLLLERMGLAAAPQDVPQARPLEPAAPAWSPPEPAPTPAAGPAAAPPAPDQVEAPSPVPEPGGVLAPPGWSATEDDWPAEVGPHDPLAPDEPVSRPLYPAQPGLRVLIDQVQVSTYGLESTVEVQLTAGDRRTTGVASGPAVDSYLVRLAAMAAAKAIDGMLRDVTEPDGPSRCFVEHTGVVAFGSTEVAVVVVLLVCGGWVEQLTGSALVDSDPRQAVVRATLGAVNRRLEALLA